VKDTFKRQDAWRMKAAPNVEREEKDTVWLQRGPNSGKEGGQTLGGSGRRPHRSREEKKTIRDVEDLIIKKKNSRMPIKKNESEKKGQTSPTAAPAS